MSEIESNSTIHPESMAWTDAGDAKILWSDGHDSIYSPAYLRSICPCAYCKGTHGTTPQAYKMLNLPKLAPSPRQTVIRRIEPMGNYALAITWGDGHKDGIYTWALLRKECPCEACKTKGNAPSPLAGQHD